MQTDSAKSCNYFGRYSHSEAGCYKKQADEKRSRNQKQNMQSIQILKKEVTTPAEQKEKPSMYVQEVVSEQEDDEVLMKRFSTREPVQEQGRFEEEHSQT